MGKATLIAAAGLLALVCVSYGFASAGDLNRTGPQTQQLEYCCGDCTCECCVDEDGDGVCDNCGEECVPVGPDDDGDGIPNGQDDDYEPPQDGTGDQHRNGR